jgi:hypothetical protein
MTIAAVPAGMFALRPAWRSLLWIVPPTLLWIVLIYWQPVIPGSGVPTTTHQLMAHALSRSVCGSASNAPTWCRASALRPGWRS